MGIVPFNFDGQPVRVLEIAGDPWFVGKDVAEALGYKNARDALGRHCKRAQDVGGSRFPTPSDLDPQTKIIPEGDVYRLIVRSNLPSAERFEALVMDEILPTIRKTGSYGAPADHGFQIPRTIGEALRLAADQAEQIEEMKPKALAFDRLDTAEGNLTVRPASKVLGIPEHKFTKWMEVNRWAFRQNGKGPLQAYIEKRNAGYLDHKLGRYVDTNTGEDKVSATLVVTPKGMARLAKLLSENGGE